MQCLVVADWTGNISHVKQRPWLRETLVSGVTGQPGKRTGNERATRVNAHIIFIWKASTCTEQNQFESI